MIVRVLTARVRPINAGMFNHLVRQQLPILREQPGLVYVKLARRFLEGGDEEVILFEEWEDPDALYGWVGSDIQRPRLLPGTERYLAELAIAHFEALDLEPGTRPSRPRPAVAEAPNPATERPREPNGSAGAH
ncbi:MAG: antibiotic biosynthesis monooxygenase family protein [Chloroflexota bacterium]|jgi:quinol monooxygenase YgiN